MSEEVVILSRGEAKVDNGSLVITTPHGDILRISPADVMRSDSVDASGEIKRYVINSSSKVQLDLDGKQLTGLDAHDGTILKYYDDGGTISKSRDDD